MSEPEPNPPAGHRHLSHETPQARLQEAEMMDKLRAAGPNSDEVTWFRGHLLDLGFSKLSTMNRAGTLFPAIRELNIELPRPPADWPKTSQGLIYSAVKSSVEPFLKTAVFGTGRSRWAPDGGASVETYFIKRCLYMVVSLYKKEQKLCARDELPYASLHEDVPGADGGALRATVHQRPVDDPESRAVDADTLRRLRPMMKGDDALIVKGRAEGLTHSEIGEELKITGNAVSGRLRRLRDRIGR